MLKLKDAGFSEEAIVSLCAEGSTARLQTTVSDDRFSPKTMAGLWEGQQDDGANIRLVIGEDGTYDYRRSSSDGQFFHSWGSYQVIPLERGKLVLHIQPRDWEPKGPEVSYKQGLISTVIEVPDVNTIEFPLYTLKRVSGGQSDQ